MVFTCLGTSLAPAPCIEELLSAFVGVEALDFYFAVSQRDYASLFPPSLCK